MLYALATNECLTEFYDRWYDIELIKDGTERLKGNPVGIGSGPAAVILTSPKVGCHFSVYPGMGSGLGRSPHRDLPGVKVTVS